MIRITVYDLPVRRLQGTSKVSGKPYDMSIQTVYAHTMDTNGVALPVPEKFEVVLDKEQSPYPPGDYQLSPASLYVDRDGRLAVAPRLVPLTKRTA